MKNGPARFSVAIAFASGGALVLAAEREPIACSVARLDTRIEACPVVRRASDFGQCLSRDELAGLVQASGDCDRRAGPISPRRANASGSVSRASSGHGSTLQGQRHLHRRCRQAAFDRCGWCRDRDTRHRRRRLVVIATATARGQGGEHDQARDRAGEGAPSSAIVPNAHRSRWCQRVP